MKQNAIAAPGIDHRIVDAADQFTRAARLLMKTISKQQCVLPFFMNATFAIELYFKALNATTVETPVSSGDAYWLTSEANQKGHYLEPLYDCLHATHRSGLEQAFKAASPSTRAKSLRNALSPYNTMFEDSRYHFEGKVLLNGKRSVSGKSAVALLALVELIGDYAHDGPAKTS